MASLERRLTLLGKFWTVQAKSWWWIWLNDEEWQEDEKMEIMLLSFFFFFSCMLFSFPDSGWLTSWVYFRSRSFVLYASQSNLYVQILVAFGLQARFPPEIQCTALLFLADSFFCDENHIVQEGWMRFSDYLFIAEYFLLHVLFRSFLCSACALLWNATKLCFYFRYARSYRTQSIIVAFHECFLET